MHVCVAMKCVFRSVIVACLVACLGALAGCAGGSKDPAQPMLTAGQVAGTNNPQVALYTMTLPSAGSMSVEFGADTSYGRKTWARAADGSGKVSVFVAGMRASTTYHMRGVVTFANGTTANDVDHTFTTGAVPANMQMNVKASAITGMTPQSGVELLNALSGTPSGVVVTDLAGNTLWT